MNLLYGMDSPFIVLNIVLWISLMLIYSKITKNNAVNDFYKFPSLLFLTYLVIFVNLIIVSLVLFDFSFYVEPPRNLIHVILLLIPAILWGGFYFLKFNRLHFFKNKRPICNSIGSVILQWGIIVLFVDVIFYLFPYGYLHSYDYFLLIGILL